MGLRLESQFWFLTVEMGPLPRPPRVPKEIPQILDDRRLSEPPQLHLVDGTG